VGEVKEPWQVPFTERYSLDRPWADYPAGTRAVSSMGGHWTKLANGLWQANGGAAFPTPGGDAAWIQLPDTIMPDPNEFNQADYYSTDPDVEQLTCDDPDEAIREALEYGAEPLDALSPLTVYAWRRMTISAASRMGLAEYLVEKLEDHLSDDDMSDPDGDSCLSKEDREALTAEAFALVESFAAKAHVWGCEKCASRVFSAEELAAWVRENEPDWLDGASDA
jgi:hypothetical protein